MEDPEEDWAMEEYFPCSSGEDESESKVGWIWNRGLELGKTVFITGVVISSAPLVLPPLVVVSALGFAVSVPFGVVFASYACTEKLMSKLLPMPVPSPLLEYESLPMDETEEESEFGRGLVMEEDGEYLEGEDKGSGGIDTKTEGSVEEVDKKPLIEEGKNERPSPEVKRVVVVVGGEKKNDNEVTKSDELVVVAKKVKSDSRDVQPMISTEDHNKLKEGTTGLLEETRDEGKAVESMKKHKKKNKHHHSKKSHGIVGKKEDKHGKNVDEKMIEQIDIKGDETVPDVEKKSTKEADEDVITTNVVTDDRSSDMVSLKSAGNQGKETNGNRAPENGKTIKAEAKPGAGIQESGVHYTSIDENEGKSIGSNAERRETDERGTNAKTVDSPVNSVKDGFPKPKHDGVISDDPVLSSIEITSSEEKIWEQINALRVIVGYKAARQSSCTEELKALYIFTGVEPPSSFDKSSNLSDTENKLHFLMSVVGVK